MTLEKLAAFANVSVATASRALNNSRGVSDETRKMVLQAAENMGYFKDKKQIRVENRRPDSLHIAIICPEIVSWYYSGMAVSLISAFRSIGCSCTVYNSDFDENELYSIIGRCCNDRSVDAVICFDKVEGALKFNNTPIVVFGRADGASQIIPDMTASYELLLELFKNRDIKKVAFAGEKRTVSRETAFFEACGNSGVECSRVFRANERFERAGVEAALQILKEPELPKGIICAYDEIAFGLIDTLIRSGIKVPGDISVAGTNDVPAAKYVFGGLTTVGFEFEKISGQIAEDIISDSSAGKIQRRIYKIPFKLEERET